MCPDNPSPLRDQGIKSLLFGVLELCAMIYSTIYQILYQLAEVQTVVPT
jgi:hypothetical protein